MVSVSKLILSTRPVFLIFLSLHKNTEQQFHILFPVLFRWKLNFIKSDFNGLLPSYYLNESNATKIVRDDMNDANEEEKSRYVSCKCSYHFNSCEWELISVLFSRYLSIRVISLLISIRIRLRLRSLCILNTVTGHPFILCHF